MTIVRTVFVFAIFCAFSVAAFGQTPTIVSVLNGADFSTNLSPGVSIAVFGTNFGPTTSGTVTTVTITVGTTQGYVAAVISGSPNSQLNGQIPLGVATGQTTITVTVNGVTSAPFNITLNAYSPAFFVAAGNYASLTRPDGTVLTVTDPALIGDTLSVFVTGLGATGAGGLTTVTPTLTVGGQNAMVLAAAALQNFPGLYQINFMVPAGVQGNPALVLSIGGISSNPSSPVTMRVFGISAIVSNASFGSAGIGSACSIASIFGNGFGTTDQTVGFPATSFQSVSVTFNGEAAPFFHLIASQGQMDVLIPCDLPTSGVVNVAVTNATATGPDFALTMAAATPGMYYLQDPSMTTRFNALAQFNNTHWLDMPASMAAALKFTGNCTADNVSVTTLCAQPAAPGDFLVLYLTGLGLATPNGDPNGQPLATGDVAPADGSVLYKTVDTPTVTVGGLPVKVLFSGLTPGFAGLYQIDFQVISGVTGDDVPIAVSISGSPADTRTISIQVPST